MKLNNERIKTEDWRKHAQSVFNNLIIVQFPSGGIVNLEAHLISEDGLIRLHYFLHDRKIDGHRRTAPRVRARLEGFAGRKVALGEFDLKQKITS